MPGSSQMDAFALTPFWINAIIFKEKKNEKSFFILYLLNHNNSIIGADICPGWSSD